MKEPNKEINLSNVEEDITRKKYNGEGVGLIKDCTPDYTILDFGKS